MGRRRRSIVISSAVAAASVPLVVTAATAAPGDLQLVPGTGGVDSAVISADGETVAWSIATGAPATGQNARQVFARSLTTGTTVLVSAAPSGEAAAGDSVVTSVSGDGRLVAFASSADDLVPGDTNGVVDVFVRDLVAGTTRRVSVASDGTQARGESLDGHLSDDGRRIAFTSRAENLVAGDTNRVRDVFVHDVVDGSTRRVSVGDNGQPSIRPTGITSFSADGRHVAFLASWSSLTSRTATHRFSVFVHDLPSGRTERVSVDRRGGVPDGRSVGGSLSADGRFVVFQSTASDLVAEDTDDDYDVFVRDRRRERTELVSLGRARSGFASWDGAISDSGRFVVFSDGRRGRVHDRRTDSDLRVSPGAGPISGNGRRLLLRSPRPLLPEDSGQVWDLYVLDVR